MPHAYRTHSAGKHAIVIGASMGGLAAARVLAERYEQVTLIDRDSFADGNTARKGVPHALHAHGLLVRGRQVLESLFPGITDELVGMGAIDSDLVAHSIWFNHGVYLAQARSGLDGLLLSRPLLEGHVRKRLLQLPNVRMAERTQVTGLAFDASAGAVTGITVRASGADETMTADLVIDATGRGSRSPVWLMECGYAMPEEERIEVGIGYTTRIYRRRPGDLGGSRVVAVRGKEPNYRFGVALAQEDDRWIVTLGGYLGHGAPADQPGFEGYARSLPTPELHCLVSGAEPLSEFRQFRFPASVRRRYDRLTRFPKNYLVIADALCSFNPAYGQGMSAALLEAEALGQCLDRGTAELAQRFFSTAQAILDAPWQIAVGNDLANPNVAGRRTLFGRFFGWYIAKLHRAAARDATLAARFIAVANLMAPPAALLRPGTALRVLAGNRPVPVLGTPAAAPSSVGQLCLEEADNR